MEIYTGLLELVFFTASGVQGRNVVEVENRCTLFIPYYHFTIVTLHDRSITLGMQWCNQQQEQSED